MVLTRKQTLLILLVQGVLFLRNQDIKETFVDLGNNVFITQEIFNKLTLKLQELDIIIPRVGTLGNAAIIEKTHLPCSANQNLAVIRLKNEINPYFVTLFLCSFNGKQQIFRTSTGNVQQWLNLATIGRIKIPIFPMPFQLEIEKLVKDSHKALESSKALYKEAEALLYEALWLDSKNPLQSILNIHANRSSVIARNEMTKQSIDENLDCHADTSDHNDNMDSMDCHENPSGFSRNDKIASPNYTIATLRESFLKTGRLDAEYYQSKYEKNEALLKSLPHKRLHELVDIYKSIEPGSDFYKEKGLPFVRVSNLSKFGVGKSEVYLDFEDFAKESLQSLYPKKDDVLLSKDGSVGIAYAVENDLECVLSGAILRLKIKDKAEIKPKYLSLVLNAITTQLQAQRDCGGSIIAHWRLEEIQNLLIPLLDSKTQEKIESKISQSFALRAKSKELLESAKQRVENAIHENQ